LYAASFVISDHSEASMFGTLSANGGPPPVKIYASLVSEPCIDLKFVLWTFAGQGFEFHAHVIENEWIKPRQTV
jgi:hypothetical protein